ncbi:MAG: hypothetical protein IT245_07650 [Bacteroidia bacterium]|nr:hypothetical protein [Bacteroidia bacterium]
MSGTVTENITLAPISGAIVTLSIEKQSASNRVYYQKLGSTLTREDGSYDISFDWDKHETYVVQVSCEHYIENLYYNAQSEFKQKSPKAHIILKPKAYVLLRMKGNKGASEAYVNLGLSNQDAHLYKGQDSTFISVLEGNVPQTMRYSKWNSSGVKIEDGNLEFNIKAKDTVEHLFEF